MPIAPRHSQIQLDKTVLRQACERPRLLTDLPPELAALIEDVTVDSRGRLIAAGLNIQ